MKGKILVLLIILLSLITCTKAENINDKSGYLNYEKFKKKYTYFYYGKNDFYCNVMVPSDRDLPSIENRILSVYIKEKEENLENLKYFEQNYSNRLNYEEQIKQLGNLIVEVSKENKILTDINILLFLSELLKELEKSVGMKSFYEIIEKNYEEEDIQIIIEEMTYNSEFEYYDVEKELGLEKVDKINRKLGLKKGLTEEEWRILEGTPYKKRFENEISEIMDIIYLLSDNKILIINDKDEILKEIKVKDYRETDYLVYKDILYIYSDKKIYEVPLNNLNKVKVVNVG